MVLYLAIVSILGLIDYSSMKQYIPTWENSKYYANMACAWSWSYEKMMISSMKLLFQS